MRYPHTVTRVRSLPGGRNDEGVYVPGTTTSTPLRANVQPVILLDEDFEGASMLSQRVRVYTPGELAAASVDGPADKVIWGGDTFVVTETRTWPSCGHTRALLLRES